MLSGTKRLQKIILVSRQNDKFSEFVFKCYFDKVSGVARLLLLQAANYIGKIQLWASKSSILATTETGIVCTCKRRQQILRLIKNGTKSKESLTRYSLLIASRPTKFESCVDAKCWEKRHRIWAKNMFWHYNWTTNKRGLRGGMFDVAVVIWVIIACFFPLELVELDGVALGICFGG